MKQTLAASSALLLTLAAAKPQGPPGGFGGPGGYGPFAAFPSCVDSCWSDIQNECSDASDYSCFCSSNALSTGTSCIEDSDCSDDDKDNTYQAVAQLCANAGATVTSGPVASYSATSGGSAWPSGWTTNSAWPTSGPWGSGGPGGWSGANGYGPFGRGGPQNGWGPWAASSTGAWTEGPWTSWWGGDDCPGSTWSGWTEGPWSSAAPWTSWDGCTATTTDSAVVTTTVSGNGTVSTVTTTSYGIEVAARTGGSGSSDSDASDTSEGAAPRQTGFALPAAAAGVLGVIGGALVL